MDVNTTNFTEVDFQQRPRSLYHFQSYVGLRKSWSGPQDDGYRVYLQQWWCYNGASSQPTLYPRKSNSGAGNGPPFHA